FAVLLKGRQIPGSASLHPGYSLIGFSCVSFHPEWVEQVQAHCTRREEADRVSRGAIENLRSRHTVREDRWMNAKLRYFGLGVIIVLLLLALFTLFQNPGQHSVSQVISLSQFLNDVDQGKVRDVVIQGQEIRGTYVDGHGFNTNMPNDPTLLQRL